VLRLFQEQKGEGSREAARAREAAVAVPAGRPEEADDREGRAGWAGQRLRPSGDWRRRPKRREKESGPVGVEGEVGRGWVKSGAGHNSKEILFKFQLILEFGKTLENCTRRFRKDFFLKSSTLSQDFRKMEYAMP
jgi:hypothetical protein